MAASRVVARQSNVVSIARALYDDLTRALDVPVCFVGLYNEPAQSVDVVWQVHRGAELPGGSFPLGNGFTSQVIQTRQPLLIRDWPREGPKIKVQYATDQPGLPQSGMTVPLKIGERVLGVVSVQSYAPAAFDQHALELLQGLADRAAVALQHVLSPERSSQRNGSPSSESDAILASLSDALLVLDAQGRIVRLNPAARRLLSEDDEASLILGQPLDERLDYSSALSPRAIGEQLGQMTALIRRGQTPPEVEARDGERRFNVRGTVLRSGNGTAAGGVLVIRELVS